MTDEQLHFLFQRFQRPPQCVRLGLRQLLLQLLLEADLVADLLRFFNPQSPLNAADVTQRFDRLFQVHTEARYRPVLDNEATETNVTARITVAGEESTLPQKEGEGIRKEDQQSPQCREEPPNYTVGSLLHA